jgi:hypothetical protein
MPSHLPAKSADEVYAAVRASRQANRLPWQLRRRVSDVGSNAVITAARIGFAGQATELGVAEISRLSGVVEAAVEDLYPAAAAAAHARLSLLVDAFSLAVAAEIAELGDW